MSEIAIDRTIERRKRRYQEHDLSPWLKDRSHSREDGTIILDVLQHVERNAGVCTELLEREKLLTGHIADPSFQVRELSKTKPEPGNAGGIDIGGHYRFPVEDGGGEVSDPAAHFEYARAELAAYHACLPSKVVLGPRHPLLVVEVVKRANEGPPQLSAFRFHLAVLPNWQYR